MTLGGIGCALSHLRCWNDIINKNLDAALILEDDIRMDSNFNDLIKKYSNSVPESYDILFIGYHPASIKYVDIQSPNDFIKSKKVYGLFGYIVSSQGAKKLLRLFPIEDQIDTEIYRGFLTHNIDAYVIRPELRFITSDPSEEAKEFGTDIQTRDYEQIKENFNSENSIMNDLFCLVIVVSLIFLSFLFIDNLISF
jgi:GR25 family glycosyltransferase involved in LPS biosynthesis